VPCGRRHLGIGTSSLVCYPLESSWPRTGAARAHVSIPWTAWTSSSSELARVPSTRAWRSTTYPKRRPGSSGGLRDDAAKLSLVVDSPIGTSQGA